MVYILKRLTKLNLRDLRRVRYFLDNLIEKRCADAAIEFKS